MMSSFLSYLAPIRPLMAINLSSLAQDGCQRVMTINKYSTQVYNRRPNDLP